MSSYPLSNVLLPAVIISSAVFSTLTVPFAFINKEPVVVEVPPFFNGEIQPIFNGEHKDVAIPYVGFAIVVSVGAGMASVEITRRWNAYRESALAHKLGENLQSNSLEQEAQREGITLPEYRPEISALDLPLSDDIFSNQSPTVFDATPALQDISLENLEQVADAPQQLEPQVTLLQLNTTISTGSEQPNLPLVVEQAKSIELGTPEVSFTSTVHSSDLAASKILESRTQYQHYRIQVPHLKQRLLAILVEGQYYSFFRTETTKEKVLEILNKLSHKIQKFVITKTEKGYFIWVWEPKAYSELSS